MHAVLPFPDSRKPQPDLAASQALQPVPGTLAASRALPGTVSVRLQKQAQQAIGEAEQGASDDEANEPLSRGVHMQGQGALICCCSIPKYII